MKYNRQDFEIFKGNVCNRVKYEGQIKFIQNVLSSSEIEDYWEKDEPLYAMYILAMVDYLSRINEIPIYSKYDYIRQHRMKKRVYPLSMIVGSITDDEDLEQMAKDAIPEFIHYNIVEGCLQPENQELGNIIINQFLPRKNKLSLSEIPFDSDEVIYIKSSHGTTFETTPRTITHDKKVLPKLPRGTSYPELFIFYYIESIFPEAIHRGKAYGTVEYDITIPEKKACIEYNGSAFHKGKYARPEIDASKLELCRKKGVKYIRIEDDGDTFEPKIKDWLVTIKYEESKKQEQLMLLCKRIVKKYFHSNKQGISLEEIEKKIRLYY